MLRHYNRLAAAGAVLALIAVVASVIFAVWNDHQIAEKRDAAEAQVLDVMWASGLPALATATDRQIISQASKMCPQEDKSTFSFGGDSGDAPASTQDDLLIESDQSLRDRFPPTAGYLAWFELLREAVEETNYCEYRGD